MSQGPDDFLPCRAERILALQGALATLSADGLADAEAAVTRIMNRQGRDLVPTRAGGTLELEHGEPDPSAIAAGLLRASVQHFAAGNQPPMRTTTLYATEPDGRRRHAVLIVTIDDRYSIHPPTRRAIASALRGLADSHEDPR